VTARQDSAGEWRAKRVEILHLPTQVACDRQKAVFLPDFAPDAEIPRITPFEFSASHPIRA
jgi:hypothetical protein